MGRRHAPAILLVAAVLLAGCGGGKGPAPQATSGVGEGPVTIPVGVDARSEDFPASLFAYFPRNITVRPGDSVSFTSRFTGEPHTVALGTLVDEALAAFEAVPPGTAPPQQVRDLLARVPTFYPPPPTPVDADPNAAAAQPCFIAGGELPPQVNACSPAQQQQPRFTGRELFYSSGFITDEEKFDVKLAATIRPGTYRFMCLVDRTDMRGTLTVVDRTSRIPSPEDVRRQGTAEVDGVLDRLRPRADVVLQNTTPQAMAGAPPEERAAGTSAGEVPTSVNVLPRETTVPAGGTVTWAVNGAHALAFNAPEDARPLYGRDAQGVARANKKGFTPAGGAGQPPPGTPAPVVVDGGVFDGTGFRNSGLLTGEGTTYRLTFTKPGTYAYQCNFHTDMEGTVKVV